MPGRLDMITPAESIRDGGNVRSPVVIRFQPTLSPAGIAAAASGNQAEQALTVAGLLTSDVILSVNKPANQANLGISGFRAYSAASQIAINFVISGTTSITPTASEIYQIIVLRGR